MVKKISLAVLVIITIIMGVFFVILINESNNITPEKLTVTTNSYTERVSVEIEEIITLKDKEPIYVVDVDLPLEVEYLMTVYAPVELTETEYNTYIGSETNAIEVTIHSIKAQTGDKLSRAFIATDGDYDDGLYYEGYRIVYPWNVGAQAFSESEQDVFVNAVCEIGTDKGDGNVKQSISMDVFGKWVSGADCMSFSLFWLGIVATLFILFFVMSFAPKDIQKSIPSKQR